MKEEFKALFLVTGIFFAAIALYQLMVALYCAPGGSLIPACIAAFHPRLAIFIGSGAIASVCGIILKFAD